MIEKTLEYMICPDADEVKNGCEFCGYYGT